MFPMVIHKSKVKLSHKTPWRRLGERNYSSYSFFTSALDGVSGQRYAPAELYTRERTPGTHCTGGWMGLRSGLDTDGTEKSLTSAGIEPRTSGSTFRSQTLY
jgi:hypothetical protein